MKVIGKFIGETSCGFISDWVYEIRIGTDKKNQYVWVKDIHSSACCPYTNIHTLGANWEIPTNEPFRQHSISEYPVGNNWRK